MLAKKPVVFTKHSLQRAEERFGFSWGLLRDLLLNSKEVEISAQLFSYNIQKYGLKVAETHFLHNSEKKITFIIIKGEYRYSVATVTKNNYKNPKYAEKGLTFGRDNL